MAAPAKVTDDQIRAAMAFWKTQRAAAKALGIHKTTLCARLWRMNHGITPGAKTFLDRKACEVTEQELREQHRRAIMRLHDGNKQAAALASVEFKLPLASVMEFRPEAATFAPPAPDPDEAAMREKIRGSWWHPTCEALSLAELPPGDDSPDGEAQHVYRFEFRTNQIMTQGDCERAFCLGIPAMHRKRGEEVPPEARQCAAQ